MRGGKRAGAGRPAGSRNKLTQDVKSAIESAFQEVGGHSYLVGIAKENPAVFCVLLGKVLPREISGPNGGPIPVQAVVNVSRSNRTQLPST